MRTAALLSAGLLALSGAHSAAHAQSGGNGVIYMAAYDQSVKVIDESTLEIVDEMPTSIGIPIGLTLSADHERIYVRDAEFEEIEIFDVATRRSLDSFTLSRGSSRVRIWGMEVDPAEEFVILNTMRYTKRIDRWEIDEAVLLKYDLQDKRVTDTIPCSPSSTGTGTSSWRCLNSSRAVSPMMDLALPGSSTPGSCTRRRSSPSVWMTGSPRPVWLTLRSMICLREFICSAVGWMR